MTKTSAAKRAVTKTGTARGAGDRPRGRAARPRKQNDWAWKNSIFAASLGATLIGWAVLAHTGTAAAQTPTVPAQPQPHIITIQVPNSRSDDWQSWGIVPSQAGTQGYNSGSVQSYRSQQPIFRRPITRTRHS